MLKKISLLLLLLITVNQITAQEKHSTPADEHEGSSGEGFRVAVVIGHTYIKSEGTDSHLFVPSWGLDVDYWFNHKWGIGLHNDVEIESFIVEKSSGEEIERVNPLVLTLDALYHISNGFVISVGPGIEIEENESFVLARVGLEYEYEFGSDFYMMPTLFYDHRFDGFSTATIGLGVGYKF
ncbi:hypothetical protein [Winogradskyella sp. Asnod2-B02-A]|uniref:hypothetical protein n=1 Tax=Winogradskyella sp. Asnod2-B02-A TaxID=3160583 RepID=UPI00386F3FFD